MDRSNHEKGLIMLVMCPKCNGTGVLVTYITFHKGYTGQKVDRKCKSLCSLCDGSGKVTWVDRILRKA